jgi:hypothetical protein
MRFLFCALALVAFLALGESEVLRNVSYKHQAHANQVSLLLLLLKKNFVTESVRFVRKLRANFAAVAVDVADLRLQQPRMSHVSVPKQRHAQQRL